MTYPDNSEVASSYSFQIYGMSNFVQQTGLMGPETGSLNRSSCLAPALGVTKLIIVTDMILVTLCCETQVGLGCSTNPPGQTSIREY